MLLNIGVVPYLRGPFQWVAFFPFGNTNWNANVFVVNASGVIDDYDVGHTLGLRPVVNLKSGVTITGSGTKTNPYVVS